MRDDHRVEVRFLGHERRHQVGVEAALRRVLLQQGPVVHREDHLEDGAGQQLAAGGEVLRIRALHRVDPGADVADAPVRQGERGLQLRRVAPHALRVLHLAQGLAIEPGGQQHGDAPRRRHGRAGNGRHLALYRRRDGGLAEVGEAPHGQAAVIGVVVIGGRQAQPRHRRGGVAQALGRAAAPVQPRGAIVGSRKRLGAPVEQAHCGVEPPLAVGPPSRLPGGALGEASGGISVEQLEEHRVGLVVLIVDDVGRRQRVQHLFGERAGRMPFHEPARLANVLVLLLQAARGRHRVEARLVGQGAVEPGLEGPASCAKPAQHHVARRQAHRHLRA